MEHTVASVGLTSAPAQAEKLLDTGPLSVPASAR